MGNQSYPKVLLLGLEAIVRNFATACLDYMDQMLLESLVAKLLHILENPEAILALGILEILEATAEIPATEDILVLSNRICL